MKSFDVTTLKGSLVIRPKRGSDVYLAVRLITVKKARERLLQELVCVTNSSQNSGRGEILVKKLYSYDSADLVDRSAVQIPADIPKKENPLVGRMKYP